MLSLLLHLTLIVLPAAPQAECATAAECRALAEQAAAQQDYERFHDLAWRVVQMSPRNDPAAMTLVARAMSLSGRPGDALVMLQRLAALGVGTDAATSDDFAAVRALDGWSAVAPGLAGLPPALPAAAGEVVGPPGRPAEASAAGPPPAAAAARRPGDPAAPAAARRAGGASPAAADVAPVAAASPEAAGDAHEAVRFTTDPFAPVGLAYDRVSDRFLVGDRDAQKLTVIDEASSRVANLAAARTAGFGRLAGFEIDARQGDLWVASVSGEGDDRAATLHKLQLISGRVLYAVTVADERGPSEFVDVAVTPAGAALTLDSAGGRLFELAPRARSFSSPVAVGAEGVTSLAPAGDRVVYVAHDSGIRRIDVGSRRGADLGAARGVELAGIQRLRWHRKGLVAVQRAGDGSFRIVQLALDSGGRRVTSVTVLDGNLWMPDPTAAAISGDVLYYLARPDTGSDAGTQAETVVRQVTLR